MSDIRKRTTAKGTKYQVRYRDTEAATGYSYKSFDTAKEARSFREDAAARLKAAERPGLPMARAVDTWLDICEKEGLNGREPVTNYTLANYRYRAQFIKTYDWPKDLQDLTTPDIVAFRSHLLRSGLSREVGSKVLSSLQSLMKEMVVRGTITTNCAAGITIRADSRYDEPVVIPSIGDIRLLLQAADRLSNSRNQTIAKPWQRYRPMLHLAVDSGMRPQEYIAAARTALTDRGVKVDRAIEGDWSRISVTKTAAGRRFIELSAETLDLVQSFIRSEAGQGPNDFDLIFPDRSGKWQCRRNWQHRGFDVACATAGLMVEVVQEDGSVKVVPKYRPYDLRHFFASYHISRRTNLKKLQKLMGHANIETTLNVYGHLLDDDEVTEDGLLSSLVLKSSSQAAVQ